MQEFVDMLGRKVLLQGVPGRIVSLVPSQTELLADLGLDNEVVGITKFCVHPQSWFRTKERIGGTKQLNLERIRLLKPDLIIANKEENEQEQVEVLAKEFPVWVSDISTVEAALEMIRLIGALTDRTRPSLELVQNIETGFADLRKASRNFRVAYLIWYRPWMTVGHDTFIHDILQRLGMINVFADRIRYPETSAEELKALSPDCILLSSEPFPFKENHAAELRQQIPGAGIKLVDGEMFSWYGSRMLKAVSYLKSLL